MYDLYILFAISIGVPVVAFALSLYAVKRALKSGVHPIGTTQTCCVQMYDVNGHSKDFG
ncbi:MAG TPA: hypothetical protein VK463_20260 [Desulfomonilaceae bacterium]|nr:hypothetical protein [Desulfomonilaceae bacterium]